MKNELIFGAAAILAVGVAAFLAGRGAVGGPAEAPAPVEAPTPRALAWLRDAQGRVMVGTSSHRGALASRSAVAGGQWLETEESSRAVLDLRAAGTVVAGPGTLLHVLPEERDGDAVRPTRVRFLRGAFRAESSKTHGGLLIETEEGALDVPPGGAALLAGEGDGRIAVTMLRGPGAVRARGKQTLLAEGEALRLVPGTETSAPVALPAAPRSGAGNVGRTVHAETGKAKPVFRFAGESGQMTVVVARDEDLLDIVAEATDKASEVAIADGLAPGSYYWAAAKVDPATRLPGRFSRARPIEVVSGPKPDARDEVPETAVVIGGATTTVFYGSESPLVGLDWEGLTDPRGYEVEVTAGARDVVKARTEESRLTLGSLAPGSYAWKVKGASGGQSGRFVLKRTTGSPRVSMLSRVEEKFDKSQIFFQREMPAIEFAFKPDTRAAKYRLQVARDDAFASVLATKDGTASPIKLDAGSLREGELFWRVQRLKADGGVFYPGKVQGLALRFDAESPSLELAEPRENEPVAGERIRTSGLAPLDSKLTVNGVEVGVDARGRFSAEVPVDAGDPEIVVRCVRGGRHYSYYVRRLKPST